MKLERYVKEELAPSLARFVQRAISQQYQGIRDVLISQCVHEALSSDEPQLIPMTLSRISLHSSTDEQIIFDLPKPVSRSLFLKEQCVNHYYQNYMGHMLNMYPRLPT